MAVGIVTIKVGYRHGVQTEEWSNKYHLTGPDPANPTAWRTLLDALTAEEKKLFPTSVKIVRAYGYISDADDAVSVWGVDLTVAPNTPVVGSFSLAGTEMPSDTAAWVRWKLDRNNSNGKAIFLRKYYHGVLATSGGDATSADTLLPTQKTAYTTFGNLLFTGAGIDGGRHIRDTGGGNPIAMGVSQYFTTRTLKRRGKRP